MDDEPTGAAAEDATEEPGAMSSRDSDPQEPLTTIAAGEPVQADVAEADEASDGEQSPADEIIDLPWDDDLPVALGEETEMADVVESDAGGDGSLDEAEDVLAAEDQDGDGPDDDPGDDVGRSDEYFARRRVETRRSLDSWRSRSATGAIASAIAMGLQQVFEPEKRRPAMVAEAPSDPYSDDDPVTVEYVPDDAEATTVRVKPWLLQKGDPA